ncbi:hypothetical protein [Rhodospirillum rubrum]|uniref:hypothetical protein n=1 Tax=Rhodospirillum rubrum TaxID=1085 RepID=UPI001F5BD1D0|nr:hypothetical protein [Rhodospirillum rubrum]
MALTACQTSTPGAGRSLASVNDSGDQAAMTQTAAVSPAPAASSATDPSEADLAATDSTPIQESQEAKAEEKGFHQIRGERLKTLVSGKSYAFTHPRGAEITMTFRPNGQTEANWKHPTGMTGQFEEKWMIANNEQLCGIGDEGTKCGTLFQRDDKLVKIFTSGRVDEWTPVQNVAAR